jgi:hypothetical protein
MLTKTSGAAIDVYKHTLAMCLFGPLWLFALIGPLSAAEIERGPVVNGITPISLIGEIVVGDWRDFAEATEGLERVTVILSSPGGNVSEALKIGSEIRLRGWGTMTADECASACGLIWLSGTPRHLIGNARVGFHAAYVIKNGSAYETGMGNADVGSFLTYLGLSRDAIQFITAAPPGEMRWLTREDAQRLGIAVISSGLPGQTNSPAYERNHAKGDEDKAKIAKLAGLASELIVTKMCKEVFRVNDQEIQTLHSQLMEQGKPFGDRFAAILGDELEERVRELRRDGLERTCSAQREKFLKAGIKNLYLN